MGCNINHISAILGTLQLFLGSTDSFDRGIICYMKNHYAVEWSPSQQCFHLQTLAEMLRDNLRVFKGESMTDYLCIGIFETYEQASNYIRQLRGMVKTGR
jgi:hypothetical protein